MKDIKAYLIKGILFVSLLGTIFHFVYGWSGNNIFVGLFAPINESIWEHTKLIFFPMLIYSYLERKICAKCPSVKSSIIFGALCGIWLIISLFYTYSGIIGFHFAFADISIFYISVILSFYIAFKKAVSGKENRHSAILKILSFIMICLYILFTFYQPNIPLFAIPH